MISLLEVDSLSHGDRAGGVQADNRVFKGLLVRFFDEGVYESNQIRDLDPVRLIGVAVGHFDTGPKDPILHLERGGQHTSFPVMVIDADLAQRPFKLRKREYAPFLHFVCVVDQGRTPFQDISSREPYEY